MDTGESTYGYRGSKWLKRIVVAADGSPATSRGLEQVADLARTGLILISAVHGTPAGICS